MKLKNTNLSLFVLAGLIMLSLGFFAFAQEKSLTANNIFLDSDQDGLTDEEERAYGTDPQNRDTDNDSYSDGAEVESGYDPKKPAPGDRIIPEQQSLSNQVKSPSEDGLSEEDNMTAKVAQKVSELTRETDGEAKDISMEEIQSLVNEALASTEISDEEMPVLTKEDIKILEQDYDKYSDEEAQKRKKEDFAQYITAVFYIMSSNSPKPLTSAQDFNSVISSVTQDLISAISSRSPSSLDELEKSGQKILEQMKEVEVPEEMADTHLKALQFAMYSQNLKNLLAPNAQDPLADIANLSKIEGFIQALIGFSSEVQAKFVQYDIDYDKDLKDRMEDYGLDFSELKALTNLSSSDDDSADDDSETKTE